MLVITRKINSAFTVKCPGQEPITVTMLKSKNNGSEVLVGIDAPKEVAIERDDIVKTQ